MSYTIMIVDDSDVIRFTLNSILSEKGYKVIEAINGQEALDSLGTSHLDLIITDLHMPVMDGLDFVKHLKLSSLYSKTPIFMLTMSTDKNHHQQGLNLGVDVWMTKPVYPMLLLSAIEKFLPYKSDLVSSL